MPAQQWRQQTEVLKSELTDAITSMEAAFQTTIPNYLCLNNLKAKLARVEAIEGILAIEKHTLVFIGTIGEGKTTAICHLFNLIGKFNVSKTIAGKPTQIKEIQELLATGPGRITICEVILKVSDKTYVEIDPYSREEMERLIFDFCESLLDSPEVKGEPKDMLSKEIERAIRNVIQLKDEYVRNPEGDKPATIRIDRARKELEKSGLEGLKGLALRNANLDGRTETKITYGGQEEEPGWIKGTFARVNSGELPTFAIPRKIYVGLSATVLEESPLSSSFPMN